MGIDAAQTPSPVELGAQQVDQPFAEVGVLAPAAHVEGQDRDGGGVPWRWWLHRHNRVHARAQDEEAHDDREAHETCQGEPPARVSWLRVSRSRPGELLELLDDLTGRGRSSAQVLGEQASHEGGQAGGHLVAHGIDGRGLLVEDRVDDGLATGATEGRRAAQQLVHQTTERPQVRACVDLLAAQGLRGHVGRRPQGHAGLRDARALGQLRQPEVEHLDLAAVGEDDVLGLDVTVQDARFVSPLEGACDLDREPQGLRDRKRPRRDTARERVALVVGQHEVGAALVGGPDLVQRADVGMIDGGDGTGLDEEALLGIEVARQVRREELEGDRAAQTGVLCAVDDAHATAPDLLEDPVAADGRTDHVWG